MQDYRRLEVWRLASDLAIETYAVTARYPPNAQYGITAQIRRSTVSVASNIAEGAGRATRSDFAQFLDIASGSAHELEAQLANAHRLGFEPDATAALLPKVGDVVRMIHALRNRVKPDSTR